MHETKPLRTSEVKYIFNTKSRSLVPHWIEECVDGRAIVVAAHCGQRKELGTVTSYEAGAAYLAH